MVTISGRTLSDESLARIGQTVEAEPTISRRPLSLRVCAWMAWHNPGGRPRDMSCRNAMLEMHRRGIITLPPVTTGYPCQHARQPVASPPLAAVACSLTDVGAVEIVRVTSRHRSALWRGMMDAHQYLKSGPLCGAQLRYRVRSERDGWIGGLSYSRGARALCGHLLSRGHLEACGDHARPRAPRHRGHDHGQLRPAVGCVVADGVVPWSRWHDPGPHSGGTACAAGVDRGGVGRHRRGRYSLDRATAADDRHVLRQADREHAGGLRVGPRRHGGVPGPGQRRRRVAGHPAVALCGHRRTGA